MKTAWYGEPELKEAAMARLREHRRLDQLRQGIYWKNGRGCHLGCLSHQSNETHFVVERMFAIPVRIGYWLEAVFEGLPPEECADWVVESTESIPVGADLSLCHHEFAYWLLGPDSPSAAGNYHELVKDDIRKIRLLHDRVRRGKHVKLAARSVVAARAAARSARSVAAAWSPEARSVVAAEAAEAAARSAEAAWSVRSAARSATAAVWSAENKARAWKKIAAKSIEIFQAAPVAECEDCAGCAAESLQELQSYSLVRVPQLET